MKTIGMIGGMSWESSSVYYQQINREVQKRLGGVHSAKFLIYSFDFDEMASLQAAARWDEANALIQHANNALLNGKPDAAAADLAKLQALRGALPDSTIWSIDNLKSNIDSAKATKAPETTTKP